MKKETIYVLGINGSPEKTGKCAKLLGQALKESALLAAKTRIIHLANYEKDLFRISHVDHPPSKTLELLAQVQEADCLIIATPVHWFGISSLTKNSPLDRGDSIRRRGHGECRADDVVLADRDAYSAYILKNRRAAYGEKIVSTLSRQLEPEFGRGFSAKALHHMVRFTEASGQQGLEFS